MFAEFFDMSLFNLVNNISKLLTRYHTDFISFGRALGGVLCLIIVAKEAYEMMLLKKGIDALALLRPVAIALVLANWVPMTYALRAPFQRIETNYSQAIWEKENADLSLRHEERFKLALNRYNRLQEQRAQVETAQKEISKGDEGLLDKVAGTVKNVFNKVSAAAQTFFDIKNVIINTIFERIIEFISCLLWMLGVMMIFFAKEVGISLLTITGPITFAMSLVPAWKDAWATWIARYISLCMYGIVAFFIMTAALQIFRYAIEVDITYLTTNANSLPNPYAISLTSLYSLLAGIIGFMGLKMVPELVTWIIPANTSQAMSRFASGFSDSILSAAKTGAKASVGKV